MAEKLKARNANFQVLSPKYDGVMGVTNLNDRLREALNPDTGDKCEWRAGKIHMRVGDRVMVTKNDYDLNVYNGDMGKLHAIHKSDLIVKIHGPSSEADLHVTLSKTKALEMLRLAYCITVHKSQGSEFDTIVMPIVRAHGRMRQRNLFYTAVTRARRRRSGFWETRPRCSRPSRTTRSCNGTRCSAVRYVRQFTHWPV